MEAASQNPFPEQGSGDAAAGLWWDELTLLSLRFALALPLMKAGRAQWQLLARVLLNSILVDF